MLPKSEEERLYSTVRNGRTNNLCRHLARFGIATCCLALFYVFFPAGLWPLSCHKSLTPVERVLKGAPLIGKFMDGNLCTEQVLIRYFRRA